MIGSGAATWRQSGLQRKLSEFDWVLLILLTGVATFGFLMLYSVADGNFQPWAQRQIIRFAMGLFILFAVALVDIRIWMKLSYVLYALGLIMLVYVEFFGHVGMGAQRWIDFGFMKFQPSEFMKIAVVMALARYFHHLPLDEVSHPASMVVPLAIIVVPVGLTLIQPDLGTAALIGAGGASLFILAGLKWRYIIGAIVVAAIAIPVGFNFLKPYQQQRVMTFLNPESDPLGAGYHILQSKTALGSGGLFGKGFLDQSTQAHLNFLPEQHTDFIFTMLAEELGLVGAGGLLLLYFIVISLGIKIAFSSSTHYGRLLAMGVLITFFFYIIINVSMVIGLVPVVGVPLPLVSYGGTSMLVLMFGFGLVQSVYIHRYEEMFRNSSKLW